MAKKKRSAYIITKERISMIDGAKAYAELRGNVIKAGILKRSYGYYAFITLIVILGIIFSFHQLMTATAASSILLWSIIFVFFAIQIAGLIHDAGHRAIFTSSRSNDIFAQLFSVLAGMGYSYWRTKHNTHHANTNMLDEDPDIDIPLLTFTAEHKEKRSRFQQFLLPYQPYLYFPLGLLSLFYFRYLSIMYYKSHFSLKLLPEILLFTLSMIVWFVVPFFIFAPLTAILLILFINLALGFYMMNIFAPNHKGMPQVKQHVKLSFLEHQVITSRNITGNWLTDMLYLGLNYQIEHHLFPNCPRNKLKKITPFVLAVCKRMDIEYTQVGIIESNRIILSELQHIAATGKKTA